MCSCVGDVLVGFRRLGCGGVSQLVCVCECVHCLGTLESMVRGVSDEKNIGWNGRDLF